MYNRKRQANTAKLNKAFDGIFGATIDEVERAKVADRSREQFKGFFSGKDKEKAGDPPAVKTVNKVLDPLDRKIGALKNTLSDPAATEGEKSNAKRIIKKLEAKKAGR